MLPPDTPQFPPTYNGGLLLLSASQQLFQVGLVVLAISAVGVVVGWRPAVSASVAAAASFYVVGLPPSRGRSTTTTISFGWR